MGFFASLRMTEFWAATVFSVRFVLSAKSGLISGEVYSSIFFLSKSLAFLMRAVVHSPPTVASAVGRGTGVGSKFRLRRPGID